MRKNFLVLLSHFLFIIFNSYAQAPAIQWQKCLGGNSVENANAILQSNDGGFIICGNALSNNGDVNGNHGGASTGDEWIVKLDSGGSLQWQKCLGGTQDEVANQVKQTNDGGYLIVGVTGSNDGDVVGIHGTIYPDCWITKLDSAVTLQWQRCLGGTADDRGYSIDLTADGGFVIGATSSSTDGDAAGNNGQVNYWIVKFDSSASIQWQKAFGPGVMGGECTMACIRQTSDGGYICCGSTNAIDGDVSGNHGVFDEWIVKLDSAGNLQWQKCLGGMYSDDAKSILQTNDNGFMIAGVTGSNDGDATGNLGHEDFWVVKLDFNGTIQWQKCFGGSGYDGANSIFKTHDDNYVIAGYSSSNDDDVSGNHSTNYDDYWAIKIDSIGTILWQKCLGGSSDDDANTIIQSADNGYVIAGRANSMNGDITANHSSQGDFWVVKLEPPSGTVIAENDEEMFMLYPNPVEVELEIKIPGLIIVKAEIVNLIGESIYSIAGNDKELTVNCSALPAGMYFVNLQTEKGITTRKFVKQ